MSPIRVILSGASTSRSEALAESKDPCVSLPLRGYRKAFAPCPESNR
jgi:hypothetical protein